MKITVASTCDAPRHAYLLRSFSDVNPIDLMFAIGAYFQVRTYEEECEWR